MELTTRKGRSPLIKNLIPGLTEKGKIKIGRKGASRQSGDGNAFQLPEKLDHFLITTLERGKDNNFVLDDHIHAKLGASPKRIPVKLMFDAIELNFQCRYACYYGRTLFCSGDGEGATRLKDVKSQTPEHIEVSCTCERQLPTYKGEGAAGNGRCKINGTLSVLIDGADSVGGVYKFRTTGYNSTVGIMSSLTLIKSLTGGYLAGLPLVMTIQPKVATNPVDGRSQTIYVVGIEYAGSLEDLRSKTMAIAQGNAEFRLRLAHVEEEARKLISVDASLIDEAGDITEEYYAPEAIPMALPEPSLAPAIQESSGTQEPEPAPPAQQPTAKRGRKPAQPAQPAQPAPTQPPQEPEPMPAPFAAPDNAPQAISDDDLNLF